MHWTVVLTHIGEGIVKHHLFVQDAHGLQSVTHSKASMHRVWCSKASKEILPTLSAQVMHYVIEKVLFFVKAKESLKFSFALIRF